MRRKSRNSGWSTAVLLLVSVVCTAQYHGPGVFAAIDSVSKGGFYRVVLPPGFVAQCRADLSDLRIYDQFTQETPYVLKLDAHDDSLNAGKLAIPDPRITRKDSSNRHTYYRLQYDAAYRMDRLSFVIRQPILYKRQAVISTLNDTIAQVVQTITIDPKDTAFGVPAIKAKSLLIDVANEDNAPLDIGRVATSQSGIYLVTLLQPGRRYQLTAGDPVVSAPDYDLHYFTDSMKAVPALVGLGPLQPIGEKYRNRSVKQPGGRPGLVLMWGLVAVILVLLLFVSAKLARAIDKKDLGKKSPEKE